MAKGIAPEVVDASAQLALARVEEWTLVGQPTPWTERELPERFNGQAVAWAVAWGQEIFGIAEANRKSQFLMLAPTLEDLTWWELARLVMRKTSLTFRSLLRLAQR